MHKWVEKLLAQDRIVLPAIILWVSLDLFILGKYSRVLVGDEGSSIIPTLLSMAHMDAIRPLWTPFTVAGTDRLATTFAPDLWSVLFRYLPGWLAYQIARLFLSTVAVIGTYLLARKKIGLSREAGLFTALLAGVYLGRIAFYIMPVAFVPLVILAIGHLLEDMRAPRRWALAGLTGFFYSVSSLPQFMIVFAPAFVALWFLCVEGLIDFRRLFVWRRWAVIGLFFIFVYALRYQELLALLFNAPLSMRGDWASYDLSVMEAFGQGLKILQGSLGSPIPFAFYPYAHLNAPLLCFYLFIAAFIYSGGKDPKARRLMILIASCAALIVLMPAVRTLLYDTVSAIRGFSFNKLAGFAKMAMLLGGGFAYQTLQSRPGRSPWATRAMVVLVLSFGLLELTISAPREWITQGSYKQIFESPVIKKLAETVKAKGQPVRVASFQMYDMYVNAYGLESPGGEVDLYPKRYNEFWNKIHEPSIDNDPVRKKYLSSGYKLQLGLTFSNVDKRPEHLFADSFRLNLLSLANVGYILSRDRLVDLELKLLNGDAPATPWFALSNREKIITSAADNFRGRTHLYVYENTAVLPRYFLARQLRVLDNRAGVLDTLAGQSAGALRETALIAKEDWPGSKTHKTYSARGRVKLEKYTADEIVFATELTGPGLLVVTNSFSPFWTCRVNGKPVPIHPIDATFWGVELPKDAKSVTFKYDPPYRL